MKKKLSTGKEIILKEMSVDEIDDCKDMTRFGQEKDGFVSAYGVNKTNTAWIRKGVENSDDKFIKSLSEVEKIELVSLIQEYQIVGK